MRRHGFMLVEGAVSAALVVFALAAVGSAIGGNLRATSQARNLERIARVAQDTLASLAERDYAALQALHGKTILDADPPSGPGYRIEFAVRSERVDLLRITTVLRDATTGNEVTRFVMHRSRR
jgi:hypothetical protein